jgi:ribonuclease P protein component
VLAKVNRLVNGDDYRRLVRRGRRQTTAHAVLYSLHSDEATEPRFGFIIAKTVGIAVNRNRVRRRLKSVAFEKLPNIAPGTEIVIRALPGAAQADWTTLHSEISDALDGA